MAETGLQAASDAGPRVPLQLREPAERGHLVIADRVVERVAVRAAGAVAGVARSGSTLERAVGRELPRAHAHISGQRVRISMEIAVVWPACLPDVTGAVREDVRRMVSSLVGLQVDAVDVVAAKVVHAATRERRRVQ